MNKNFLKRVALGLGLLTMTSEAGAQTQPLRGGQIGSDLIPARFIINAPSAIAGSRKINLASWGTQPIVPITDTVAIAIDSLALAPFTNPAALAGKFALVYRGAGVTFLQKAQYAQAAGAIGVIIVNNVPGDPVGMAGSTVTIPVLMVSDVVGAQMNTQIRAGNTVTVTLSKWSAGLSNDIGILPGYASMPHALNIPLAMFTNSQNVPAYKNWVGGAVVNFGTATQTNVTVNDSIVWVPTSGTPTVAKQHSYTIPTLAPIDSVQFGFGNAASGYYLTPLGTTGRYDYYSHIASGTPDSTANDNSNMFSQYITDSIFCKGVFDYALGQPRSNLSIQPAGGSNPFLMGPMFFITRGGHAARQVQFALTKNNATDMNGISTSVIVFKWTDANNDSLVIGEELTIAGSGFRTLTTTDSTGDFINLPIDDNGRQTILDSNSWYWVAVQSPADCFIAVDNTTSYFTRAYNQSRNGIFDYPEGAFFNEVSVLISEPGQLVVNYPFGGNAINIDSTFFDRYDQIPAVALHISKNKAPLGIRNTQNALAGDFSIFPNPAMGSFNVSLKLNKVANQVLYRLMDNMGRIITDVKHHNVKEETFPISVQHLAAGTYYLLVNDGAGTMVKKVSVQ